MLFKPMGCAVVGFAAVTAYQFATSTDGNARTETVATSYFQVASKPAAQTASLLFDTEVAALDKRLSCRDRKITKADELFGALYGCIDGPAETAKVFINEVRGGSNVRNIKVMWNDWWKDIGYGLHNDQAEALAQLSHVLDRYAPEQKGAINAAFLENTDRRFTNDQFSLSYTYTRGPAIDERLVVIEPVSPSFSTVPREGVAANEPSSPTTDATSQRIGDAGYDLCMDAADGTNAAWDGCGRDWHDREDARLNAVWKELMAEVDGETKRKLIDEQRAWIVFKEKACEFWADGMFGREGQVLHWPVCRSTIIAERTAMLSDLVDFMRPKQ